MIQILFWGLVVLALVAAVMGEGRHPRWYWVAALAAWIFSFLASFSIGIYTLAIAYAFAALAVGHSLGWLRRTSHDVLAAACGIAVWVLLVSTVDDYWLFFPVNELLSLLLSGGSTGGGSGAGTGRAIPIGP